MKFIITGATGFIGREVTQKALAAGHDVCVVTRDVTRAKRLFASLSNTSFLSLSDFLAGKTAAGYTRAIHLAWADVQNYNDEKNALENNQLQAIFLQALLNAGIEDITSAGTCLEYGMHEGICQEDMAIDLNSAKYEKETIEALWDKLVPGAMVVLDDYAIGGHAPQYEMWNEFAKSKGRMIYTSPTAQGVLQK